MVSHDCVQYDLDATALGFPLGQVPYTAHRFLAGDPRLAKLALTTPVPGQRVVAGRIHYGSIGLPRVFLRRRRRPAEAATQPAGHGCRDCDY